MTRTNRICLLHWQSLSIALMMAGCFCLSPFCLAADTDTAYAYPEPIVYPIDIVMQPSAYQAMLLENAPNADIHSDTLRKKYSVYCSVNGTQAVQATIGLRGHSSLRGALELESCRVPMKLVLQQKKTAAPFEGNDTIILVNCYSPARLFATMVATEAFRFLDIPTPETQFVMLRFNDTDFGLYLATEDINQNFLRKHFQSDGSLYKPDEDEEGQYYPIFGYMETRINQGDDTLTGFCDAFINDAAFDSFLDVDEALRFFACEAFIGKTDGFLKTKHNFFLYDDQRKLVFLPWDHDDTFEMWSSNVMYWCESIHNYETNELLSRLLETSEYREKYEQYLERLNNEFLQPDSFLPWLENYIRTIAPDLQRDPTIALSSTHMFEDLTEGKQLYNCISGNLLLTFRQLYLQNQMQLSGKADAYSLPADCVYNGTQMLYELIDPSQYTAVHKQICAQYRQTYHKVFWRQYGPAAAAALGGFCVVFALVILCIAKPPNMHRGTRRKGGG